MKTQTNRYANRKILVITAHPDDETFGMGGTLAYYGHQGAEIYLICATRGEAGEVPSEMLAEGLSIAALRERELNCAINTLGIKKLLFLGYRDSGMAGSADNEHPEAFINVPVNIVAERIAAMIRKIKPDIMITFDPNGGYFHPDHIAAHKAAVLGFKLSSDPAFKGDGSETFQPSKLYFHIIPKTFIRLFVRMMPLFGANPKEFGTNKDIDLTAMLVDDFPVHARVNYRRFRKIREMASACHASQGGDRQSGFIFTWIMRLFQPTEMFMCAFPEKKGKKIERDLLSNISEKELRKGW